MASSESHHITEDLAAKRVNSRLGSILLLFSSALSLLIFADNWSRLPFRFPDFWYQTRGFHLLACVSLYVLAWLALRNSSETEQWQDDTGPIFSSICFYTRPECCLCDDAMSILRKYKDILPEIEVIDIDTDRALTEKYSDWIPVIEIDGRVMFKGRVSPELVKRLVEARQRQLDTNGTDMQPNDEEAE